MQLIVFFPCKAEEYNHMGVIPLSDGVFFPFGSLFPQWLKSHLLLMCFIKGQSLGWEPGSLVHSHPFPCNFFVVWDFIELPFCSAHMQIEIMHIKRSAKFILVCVCKQAIYVVGSPLGQDIKHRFPINYKPFIRQDALRKGLWQTNAFSVGPCYVMECHANQTRGLSALENK